MDAYHHQHRFAGSGEAPPPQQPAPPSHWHPGPAPPYHPYPPQHHQWGPPPPDHQHQHQQHPQPPPSYAYQPPPPPMPPAPGNPWPPHHAAAQPPPPSYPPPPPGQAWPNHSWAQNHGYPGLANEDDWATKAKEWAAAKSVVTENHQIQQHAIPHHYGQNDQYQQPAGHPPIPQSSSDQLPFQMTGQQRETNYLQDRGPMAPPLKNFGPFPSTYEQEVSYNYSSAPGNGNAMHQYPSPQAQPSLTAPSVQDGFPRGPPSVPAHGVQSYRMMADPSDQPLEFDSRKAPDMAVHQTINISSTVPAAMSEHGTAAISTQSWGPSASLGFYPQAPVPPQAPQMDPSLHTGPLFGALSGSNYVPPAVFGVGSLTEAFPTDANPLFAERSKKPPVPNWLREELLKKKSTPVSASVQHSTNSDSMESEDAAEPPKIANETDSRSIGSAKSIEDDEDDEDEIEKARTAAINHEIKRVLTEVLLKVTDDLFDEIATKVMNEDDSSDKMNEITGFSSSKDPDLRESKVKTTAKVVVAAKSTSVSSTDHSDGAGLSSPKGALLGLASYDSDDEDDDGEGDGEKKFDGEQPTGNSESIASVQSVSGDNHKSSDAGSRGRPNAESGKERSIHDTQNGEATTSIQPMGVIHKTSEKAHGHTEIDLKNGKPSSGHRSENNNNVESTHRRLERNSHEEDFKKEVKVGNGKDSESSRSDKFGDSDKHGVHGSIDKKGSYKEEKGSGRYTKHGSDRWDDAKEYRKDAREGKKDAADRRGEKGNDGNDDRSRQITRSSASHSSRRSRSPSGRSRTRNESSSYVRGSVSSDEPSDNAKRKSHSRKNSMSPSPPKSRNRRVSRSPHSKHHRRHSPYSSAERKKRSRSRTPVKRR
ncbi:histone-lysine N-methyltransferase SETD1A-like [Lolium rigidum]|uniref:histone-lysine N-methyltransferase SETD1A-like n=1 Tax=Lolium rigidum TaxID=89674 RepID=UPI001F5C6BF3|nr:histone-lysine N-methyltransferase SETD1A-like [Lolium rigidum]